MTASPTPALQPIVPAYHLRLLGDEQLDRLQAAVLEVLELVGVHCPSARALGIYAEHGAEVDFERQIVRLPTDVVVRALAHAPRFYTMGARSPAHDIHLDGRALYCATDGCGVETIDLCTRQRRRSTKQDVADMARVADSLPSIGFYWPIVSAADYGALAPLHELDAAFSHTVKHVQSETVMGEQTARYAVEMARVVAGNTDVMRERPPLSLLVCCIAPLAEDKDGIESALVFAEAGLPVGFMSMANAGSTGPATLAGTMVVGDAEIVAALALLQIAAPGTPVFHSLMPGIMHPRTGGYLGSAWEGTLPYAVGVEVAHRWGVPSLAGVFGTDAPVPGWQSAGDAASSLLLCALAGAETGSGLGLLESCTLLYPEAVLLDSDVYHRVRVEAAGLDTGSEALAVDLIKVVGPRGQFLRQRATRDEMRRRQFSELSGQVDAVGQMRDPIEVARDKVSRILRDHHPQPLEAAQRAELGRILAAAGGEIGGAQ